MHRPWVILLLIVLLPLRGWAAAGMAAAVSPEPPRAEAMMPCHAMVPQGVSEHLLADASEHVAASHEGERSIPGTHPCASCSLCHAGMAAPAVGLDQPAPSPRAGPAAAHPRDTGRLWVALLERPPRA